jgi:alpha-tubulin suppressor-like RCC1 family protein
VILDQLAPSKPIGLIAQPASSTQINLNWTASSDNIGVTNYRVYRGGQLLITLGNVTSYTDAGLPSNAIYSYAVVAVDAAGNASDFSASAEAGIYTVVPVPLAVAKIAGGSGHMLALKTNGTAWAWGSNYLGQLGNNSSSMSPLPVQTSNLSGVSAVAAGANHSLALKTDQTVWAWGQNSAGQLGNNSLSDSLVPVSVTGMSSVVAIAGGTEYSAALKSNNTVWAWGKNSYGQLGACPTCLSNNGTLYTSTPIQVFSPATKIAVGIFHTLAVKTDGTVWQWGSGNGVTGTPTVVPGGLSGVTAIAGGAGFSVALSSGAVYTWGANGSGQLGVGTVTNTTTPQQVAGLPTITAIAAGFSHVLVLDANGNVWTWGYNSNGLGSSNIVQSTTPIQIPGLTGVTQITAGAYFSAALRADGTLWTWGDNGNGQLGDGTTVSTLANGNTLGAPNESKFDTGLLTSIAVVGPGSLAERTTARYTILATYDNGSTLKVPGTFSLATTSDAGLSDFNLLSGYSVSTDRTVTLSAAYTEGSITKTAALPVTIVNIAGAPGAPTQVAATVGIGQAVVSFAAPLDDGGSPITTYTVMATPGGMTASGAGSPITVTGLTFGTSYTFTVVANNAIGTGASSAPSLAASTVTVPSSPTGVSAVASSAQATVSFIAPSNGGSGITGYTVTSNPAGGGDANAGSTATSHSVLGLTNGVAYTFTVTATNAVGVSGTSAASNSVTPVGKPGAPTIGIASSGNGQATVTFTAPISNGGNAITGYTVTASPGGQIGTCSGATSCTITVTGLTNGTPYTFTVTATNGAGLNSDSSAPTNSITPMATQSIGAISFTPTSLTVGGTTTASATATSALIVTFSSATPTICSAYGSTVTAVAAGTCTIAGDQRGNAIYAAAPQVTQSFAINAPITQAITFTNPGAKTLGAAPFGLSATGGGSGNPVTFTSQTTSVCTLNGSTVTLVAAGTCTIAANQLGNDSYAAATQVTQNITVSQGSGQSLSFAPGWNLLGNSLNQVLSVVPTFADTALVTTVWKWDVTVPGWQFYAPSMTPTELQTYTTSKGYGVLSVINPGEGFWVNTKVAGTLGAQAGSSYTLTSANLATGWNLVATGNDVTPSTFNTSLSATPPSPGTIPINLTTLWAWDSTQSKWYFHAPSLEAQGGTALIDYITGKGYLHFTQYNKSLGNGMGFWLNKP